MSTFSLLGPPRNPTAPLPCAWGCHLADSLRWRNGYPAPARVGLPRYSSCCGRDTHHVTKACRRRRPSGSRRALSATSWARICAGVGWGGMGDSWHIRCVPGDLQGYPLRAARVILALGHAGLHGLYLLVCLCINKDCTHEQCLCIIS